MFLKIIVDKGFKIYFSVVLSRFLAMARYSPFTWTKIIQIRDLDSYLDREILSRVNTTSDII